MNPLRLPGNPRTPEPRRGSSPSGGTSGPIRLSIVLPVHREAERLGHLLDRLAGYLSRQPWRSEVIVVDDGSGDDTAEVAASRQVRLPRLSVLKHATRRGKGAAMRTGVLVARGDFVVLSDIGVSCPLGNLSPLVQSLEQGADVCIVSRRLPGARLMCDEPLIERLTDTAFRALAKMVVPVGVQDIQAGFKGFRRLVVQKIAMRSRIDGPAYDVEWLKLAETFGFEMAEIPARGAEYKKGEARGVSRELVRDLLRIRKNLGSDEYETPRQEGATLFDTSFVKLDREALTRT